MPKDKMNVTNKEEKDRIKATRDQHHQTKYTDEITYKVRKCKRIVKKKNKSQV